MEHGPALPAFGTRLRQDAPASFTIRATSFTIRAASFTITLGRAKATAYGTWCVCVGGVGQLKTAHIQPYVGRAGAHRRARGRVPVPDESGLPGAAGRPPPPPRTRRLTSSTTSPRGPRPRRRVCPLSYAPGACFLTTKTLHHASFAERDGPGPAADVAAARAASSPVVRHWPLPLTAMPPQQPPGSAPEEKESVPAHEKIP